MGLVCWTGQRDRKNQLWTVIFAIRFKKKKKNVKCINVWAVAVVVAQLVEQSLPTTEIRSSNPIIGKNLSTNCTFKKKR